MKRALILLAVMIMAVSMTTAVWAETLPEEGANVPADGTYENEEEPDVIPDGWSEDKGQYYVSGQPVTGFFRVDGELYFADENGNVLKGNQILGVNKHKYILKNGTIVTSPGLIRFEGDSYYISDSAGTIRTTAGFLSAKGKRYYVQSGGYIVTNRLFAVNGKTYLASGNGALRSGLLRWNRKYYFFYKDFTLKKTAGFVNANGHKYFNRKNGGIATGTFVKWNKKYYYAGSNGAILKHTFKYKKRKVHPNKKTGAISKTAYMIAIGKYKKSPYPYDSYVLIDISSQKLSYYKHGKKKLKCRVVTGNVSAGHSTPRGKFRVRRKDRGVTLKGPGYSSYVEYWMPFIGNSYGMHDASWRSSFGGSIYKGNGSHGCVNMPRWAAKKLYGKVRVGTIVVIRK